MKPGIDQHLMALTGVLATKIAPAIPAESYAVGDTKMAAALLLMLAQEADRRADTLWRENAQMRAILSDGTGLNLPADLVSQLREGASWGDDSLLVSALEANHARLSRVLIALHSAVDLGEEADEKALNARIWDLLEQMAERRMLVLPPV